MMKIAQIGRHCVKHKKSGAIKSKRQNCFDIIEQTNSVAMYNIVPIRVPEKIKDVEISKKSDKRKIVATVVFASIELLMRKLMPLCDKAKSLIKNVFKLLKTQNIVNSTSVFRLFEHYTTFYNHLDPRSQ